MNVRVRAGYVCMPRGACRAVRLAPPVRTEPNQPALLRLLRTEVVGSLTRCWLCLRTTLSINRSALPCVLVLLTWCWLCLQSTPQTQSANVTESSGKEEEAEEEAQALAVDAGSEEAAAEGQEEMAG